jgi:tRNA G18 (ribose-2'-O)-methylase SpoU
MCMELPLNENTEQVKGVGPWVGPLPADARYDADLLTTGDARNVEDRFRYMTVEAIKAELAKDRTTLHVAIENVEHDMNIGTIVRTANAFNVGAVHIIGRRQWNKRGAMVTDRYLDVFHHVSLVDFQATVRGKPIIAVDNLEGSVPLDSFAFPKDCVLVFGSERDGISVEMRELAQDMVAVEQQGSTRSLNAGVAAGIVMYAWQRQWLLARGQ